MTVPDSYAALRHSFVRSFAIGRFAAIAGWQMINVAVGWLLYERTGDAWALGLVGVAELTPVLLLMVVAGNAADRYPRRNIGIFAHTVLTLAASGLALLSWLNGPTWAIYALLFMVGTARAFASPSVNTILPQLLAPAEFANANAWLSSTFQLAAITGPAVGGMLIAATGAATLSFAVAAVGQLVFIAMLRTMPVRVPSASARTDSSELRRDRAEAASGREGGPPSASRRSASDVFAGFRFVRANPSVPLGDHARPVRGVVRRRRRAAADLCEGHPAGRPGRARLPARGARRRRAQHGAHHHAPQAVAASRPRPVVGRRRLRRSRRSDSDCRVHSPLSLFCLFLTGVFDNISVVIRLTLEQTITPDHLRGRVSAINYVFIGFSNEFGAFESGATAAMFGPTLSVVGGGIRDADGGSDGPRHLAAARAHRAAAYARARRKR